MATSPGYELTCTTQLPVTGEQAGEAIGTFWRLIVMLVTVSVVSSWCNGDKVRRLTLFFAHWLSGCVLEVCQLFSGTMVYVCWLNPRDLVVIRILRYIEHTATNMLAVTNLAICLNLALIVSSHRTMSRVNSLSTPGLLVLMLLISIAATAVVAPFWEIWVVSLCKVWPISTNPEHIDWILIGFFFTEFAVGVAMAVAVALLVVFRMPELRECWRLHRRIRFYFGLTIIAIIINLSQGICGVIFILTDHRWPLLLVVAWSGRHLHIALDTLVLYGVLGESSRGMDERVSDRLSEVTAIADEDSNARSASHRSKI